MAARLHIGGMHLVGVGVHVGLCTRAKPEPEAIEIVDAAGRLFQPAPKPRFTQCIWCWAAKMASETKVFSLSPLFAPELVNPAATLSRQVPL
jgi:hypothetical protein